jgi:hypothetical protein
VYRSAWFMPAFSVGLGVMLLAAEWAGGDLTGGIISLAIMTGFAALLVLLSRRSETVEIMRSTQRDERQAMIDLRATALAGLVVILAVIVGFVWEVAHGRDPSPYTQLGALGGVAYLVGLVVARRRS